MDQSVPQHGMSWTAHYFDRRLNSEGVSRACASKEDALRLACDLICRRYTRNPDRERYIVAPVASRRLRSVDGQSNGRSGVRSHPATEARGENAAGSEASSVRSGRSRTTIFWKFSKYRKRLRGSASTAAVRRY